jgi:glycosyltransferase involved in cell wall biosynthesis
MIGIRADSHGTWLGGYPTEVKMKIIGVCVAKDEWPLLAVAVSHALINSCDEVIVVDNGSSDASLQGLKFLNATTFQGRIHTLSYLGKFNQAAITGAAIQFARQLGAHFVVPFDADEFLVMANSISLKKYLEGKTKGLDGQSQIDSFQVFHVNYVVPRSFDIASIESYQQITARAIANQKNVYLQRSELAQLISNGSVGFFDNHFWNFKQIPRADRLIFLTKGNHQTTTKTRTFKVPAKDIYLVHLPFSSRKKLNKLVVETSFASHSSIMQNVASTSSLDQIWNRVTLDDSSRNSEIDFYHDVVLQKTFEEVLSKIGPFWELIQGFKKSSVANELSGCSRSIDLFFKTLVEMVETYLGKDFSDQVQI